MTTLIYISSTFGALTTIIGFLTLVSKPFRAWFKSCIKKTIKDDEQDLMIKTMHDDIKSLVEENKLNKEATLALLRNNITRAYYKYSLLGEIPEYERENLVRQYSIYHSMHGNSYVDILMPKILDIPVKY